MELNEYINGVLEERLADLHTIALGKIISIDGDFAQVKPLFNRLLKNGNVVPAPVINKVPIMKHRYRYTDTLDTGVTPTLNGTETFFVATSPTEDKFCVIEYRVGDVVVLAYSERSIDAALQGQEGVPAYTRKHSIDDAIIIGLIGALGNV